jgi:hypothetical protein
MQKEEDSFLIASDLGELEGLENTCKAVEMVRYVKVKQKSEPFAIDYTHILMATGQTRVC